MQNLRFPVNFIPIYIALTALLSLCCIRDPLYANLSPSPDRSIDLDSFAQDFVIETKKIIIEDYPDAFNPCIIRWPNGSLLMSFRIRDPETKATHQVGITWLDEDFNPVGKPQIIDRSTDTPSYYSLTQDPRLIVMDDGVYFVYNNMETLPDGASRRMSIAKLHYDGVHFFTKNSSRILSFENQNPKRQEKNWAPFNYQGQLLLSYSLNPHTVVIPEFDNSSAETFSTTESMIKWKWGILRGGTPAILDNDEYIGIFHSVKAMASEQSDGIMITHYLMGAYTFSSHPPFALTKISHEPIVSKSFYNGPAYKTWKPLRVVFPMGLIIDKNYLWISYGRQDHECWVAKIDKKLLLQSLTPIP